MKLIRKPVKENEPINIGPYLFKLIPYWPLFLCLFLISVIGTWIYIQVTPPLYQTTARVLIKDDKKDVQDSKSVESLDIISPKRTVDNEVEVIQSRDLINKVVTDLSLYAPVYQETRFKNKLAYNTSPVIITTNDLRTLKPVKKVHFVFEGNNVIINKVSYPLNKLALTPYGNLEFIVNPNLTQVPSDNNSFFFSIIPPQKIEESILSNLNVVVTNKQSTIIDLELKDENPDRGKDILKDIIKFYNFAIIDEKNELAANTAKFINDELTTVQNDMLKIEQEQQNYRAGRGAVDISKQGQIYLENVSTNDQKSSEISMQLMALNQIGNYVRSKNLSNGIVPSTVGINDPQLTEMVQNIYSLQLQAESLKKTAGENNPMVLTIKDQIEKIRPQILENIENQKKILQSNRSSISKVTQSYSAQLGAMPETEKKLVDINRELSLKSDIYNFLQQKKEQTALSFISNVSNSKVINEPESSDSPVSPKGKILYLGSFLVCFVLGAGFVTIREAVRPNIMYHSEIENLTDIPVISEITAGATKEAIVINNNHRTLIAEQFRRLRTTLAYLGIGNEKKRVLITSAISGEGKSFVALNLAMSLALTNKRVVLVDFDLSHPTLHTKLNVLSGKGVTEYLKKEANDKEIINQTAANSNLYFISAGTIPDNPTELILSSQTEELLKRLDEQFDYIIIDAAPVGPISDAYILSPLCDATLYIIRHDYTPKSIVERMDKNNIYNNLKNPAIVFNDVSARVLSNYGYGYGYNYIYENKHDKKRLKS